MHHRGDAPGSRLRRAWDQPTLPLRVAEKLYEHRAGASAPPTPAWVRREPSVLKEYTTGKSPENSHSRSCFCDKPVEDSPALHRKQHSARDRKWKKIRIAEAERLQSEGPGAAALRTATKVGSFPGQPQARPRGAGSPQKGPPQPWVAGAEQSQTRVGREGTSIPCVQGPGLQTPRPQWVWEPQPVTLLQGGSGSNALGRVTDEAPSLSRQGLLPRPPGPPGKAGPPGGEPAQGAPFARGL